MQNMNTYVTWMIDLEGDWLPELKPACGRPVGPRSMITFDIILYHCPSIQDTSICKGEKKSELNKKIQIHKISAKKLKSKSGFESKLKENQQVNLKINPMNLK